MLRRSVVVDQSRIVICQSKKGLQAFAVGRWFPSQNCLQLGRVWLDTVAVDNVTEQGEFGVTKVHFLGRDLESSIGESAKDRAQVNNVFLESS